MYKINKEELVQAINASKTTAEVARRLEVNYKVVIRLCKEYNLQPPKNQGSKGVKRGARPDRYSTDDILSGRYPDYQAYKLKIRLIREGYKQDCCEICGWGIKREITDEFTPCELHHIDGNNHNHTLDNLILICPNCHSLTANYRAKNRASFLKRLDEQRANSSNSIVNEELSED